MEQPITREVTIRIILFGQGPLCEAVQAALTSHDVVGPFRTPQPTELLTELQASVGLSCGYRHKLTPKEWACFPNGILNLHTSFLPWNRGAYPNVWPILDGSPAVVTLHRVDEGWDTGPIIAQKQVQVHPTDTAKTLYDKLIRAGVALVEMEVRRADSYGWGDGFPQIGKGSFHRKAELNEACSRLPFLPSGLAFQYLRAFSFPGYGLEYVENGIRIRATITLQEVTDAS